MEFKYSSDPLSQPRLLLKGFFSYRKNWYPFERFDKVLFLTDWQHEFYISKINDPAAKNCLGDKLYFHLLLQGVYNPQFVGLINNDTFISLSKIKTLKEAVDRFGHVFIKPITGSGGNGIKVAKTVEECFVNSPHIIELPVQQHDYSHKIFPETLNTIRVLTIRDDGGIFIAGAAHRFGTKRTGWVDNFGKGGIAAYIELKNGKMMQVRSLPGIYPNTIHSFHPDSGAQIEGIEIPYWDDVKDLALVLAKQFLGIYYVVWDIAVTSKGPVIIEGNANIPGVQIMQVNMPLFANPRTLEFMVNYGVVSPRRGRKCKQKISIIR